MNILDPHTVWFFEHDSTVPVITYADKELTIPNTHPVVLNVEGTWPPIFFDSVEHGVTCDCEVRNWKDQVLWKLSPMGFGPFMWPKPMLAK